MDPSRGRQQHIYKSYKSKNYQFGHHFDNNNYNTSPNFGYFQTARIQKHNFKWRKNQHYKGSYRSRHPYKKNDALNRKSNKSVEDMEEEERKKKLNDTAKKLLSKIESWNAEKNMNEESNKPGEDSRESNNMFLTVTECNSKQSEENIGGDGKKRIAHSKKPKLVKTRASKKLKQTAERTARYDVNKATVQDFQSRIQHKLIEEIMQMPKENLQNVLNDPKINPVMGYKMSRLVQENRPLITQKLRALAESKMESLGFTSNQQLLLDIDKLIDPVIETDLSALPYELIKQMENLFQVQFDYSQNNVEASQVGSDICDSTEGNRGEEMATEENRGEEMATEGNRGEEMATEGNRGEGMATEGNSLESNEKLQNNLFKEDLSLYECSTDDDEEISANSLADLSQGCNLSSKECSDNLQEANEPGSRSPEETYDNKAMIRKFTGDCQPLADCVSEEYTSETPINKEGIFMAKENQSIPSEGHPIGGVIAACESVPAKSFMSASSQTDGSCYTDASSQTSDPPEEPRVLYGVALPKESTDSNASSLLEELNSIQNLSNKLNERRLMIFLELSRKNPEGNFISDKKTKENFAETLSNGSFYLVEALDKFFKVHSRNSFTSRSDCGVPSGKWVNKNKSKNREER